MPDPKGGIALPPHMYIPGRTARHPEAAFDTIKQSVKPGMSEAELEETDAFRAGLAYLEAGFFWECHEVLEAVWMQTAEGGAAREMVQALIQLANARLKLLMGKPRAVRRLCGMVHAHLDRVGADAVILGVHANWVATQAEATLGHLGTKK